MHRARYQSTFPVSAADLFAWHERPGAFERLAPPWQQLRVVRKQGSIRDGDTLEFQIRQGPLWITWKARHADFVEGTQFTDIMEAGPFARWTHTHRVTEAPGGASVLDDAIDYELPLAPLGAIAAGPHVRADLDRLFAFRHRRTLFDLVRHRARPFPKPQRILIVGATGLVGTALAAFLRTGGHEVIALGRRPAPGAIVWDPAAGTIDAAALEGFDAIINLSGENIAAHRWSAAFKERLLRSRVEGTSLLATTIAGLRAKPRIFINASAIGIYGNRGDDILDEDAPPGTGFLPELAAAWETSTVPAAQARVRTVLLRIGVVLTPAGGALSRMLLPFSLGLGGPVGSGLQYLSWIGLDDLIGLIHHILHDESLSGPINATAPEPATNAAFAGALGNVFRRPAILPLPAPAVRAAFGEMGEALLLQGACVLPRRALDAGFRFLTPGLPETLRHELGLDLPAWRTIAAAQDPTHPLPPTP